MPYRYFCLFLFFLLTSCIEPYDGHVRTNIPILIVDGILTDTDERQIISLKRTFASVTDSVVNARLEVVVNGNQSFLLTDLGRGQYALPNGFRGKVGSTYQLKITTPDGQRYESNAEEMLPVAPIQSLSQKIDPYAIKKDEYTRLPGHRITVHFDDPPGIRNFYQWKFTHWERQYYCETCSNALYMTNIQGCLKSDPPPASPFQYDYICDGECWDIHRNTALTIFSDLYSNGRRVDNQEVALIPLYQWEGALVEVEQRSLSAEAYRYFQLLEQQSQRTGTLADTPPAAIIGNVKNLTDPEAYVAGYFSASSVSKLRYSINRFSDASHLTPIGLLPHYFVPEPPWMPGRPPLATCKPSASRTPIKPEGWK